MDVEPNICSDRPATSEELRSIPNETPEVTGFTQFEDLCKVTVVESFEYVEADGAVTQHCYPENWFFRTN